MTRVDGGDHGAALCEQRADPPTAGYGAGVNKNRPGGPPKPVLAGMPNVRSSWTLLPTIFPIGKAPDVNPPNPSPSDPESATNSVSPRRT
jgi:hypothetical protein